MPAVPASVRALLGGALLALPAVLPAQVRLVDEGSFVVTRAGTPIGREEFRIVRQPAGGAEEFVASALGAYGDRRVAPALRTDAQGLPLRYQVEVRAGGAVQQRVTGQLSRNHFTATVSTGGAEASREYLVGDGALLLDDEVFHQYWFVARRQLAGGGAMTMVSPRRNVQGPLRVRAAGSEAVTIGGTSLQATRLEVTEPDGRARTLWVDAQGRLLRVASPAEGLVAQRDDPPR